MRFLANELLDVPVQQLEGRVQGVIGAALISLRDEGSHNIGKRAAVIPHMTAGDVVFSGVADDTPEDFFTSRSGSWQRCFSESPLSLCCESLPVSLAEVRVGTRFPRWRRVITREGDGYGEEVRTKSGQGESRHIKKEMVAQKGDSW